MAGLSRLLRLSTLRPPFAPPRKGLFFSLPGIHKNGASRAPFVQQAGTPYRAASFSFFSGRTFTLTVAGFAANH